MAFLEGTAMNDNLDQLEPLFTPSLKSHQLQAHHHRQCRSGGCSLPSHIELIGAQENLSLNARLTISPRFYLLKNAAQTAQDPSQKRKFNRDLAELAKKIRINSPK